MWTRGHEVLLALVVSGKVSTSKLAGWIRSVGLEGLAGLGGAEGSRAGLTAEELGAVAAAQAAPPSLAARMKSAGRSLLVLGEPGYPELLNEIHGAPPVLFTRGEILARDRRALAIVGSRRPTLAGARMAAGLAADLARAGFTIVSGLARGIDTAAHRGALEAGGRSIAVLGSGLDAVYPPENRGLADRIASSGAVVTEFAPDDPPAKWNFPRRNRLISGLAMGAIVVEAGERSGALITAGYALEQNRTVFAVPGSPGFARTKGANGLIKQGASLVEAAADVLSEIEPQLGQARLPLPAACPVLAGDEARVVRLLSDAPAHVDEVSRHLGMKPQAVLGLLLVLEARGLVRSLPGKYYVSEAC